VPYESGQSGVVSGHDGSLSINKRGVNLGKIQEGGGGGGVQSVHIRKEYRGGDLAD